MIFETVSGSVYEINESKQVIRRLSGVKDPTERQGSDSIWKYYEKLFSPPTVGESLVIVWKIEEVDGEMVFRTTQTSPIIGIKS